MGTHGWGGSSPDNAGTGRHCQTVRVRQARREGVRQEPVVTLRQRRAGSNLADVGRSAVHARRGGGERLRSRRVVAGEEARGKGCGVPLARLPGYSWAPTSPGGGERGKRPVAALPALVQRAGASSAAGGGSWRSARSSPSTREACTWRRGTARLRRRVGRAGAAGEYRRPTWTTRSGTAEPSGNATVCW